MRTLRNRHGAARMVLTLFASLGALAARPAAADSCTFTYTCGGSCGDLGSSGTIGPIPGDLAFCQQTRATDLDVWGKLGASVSASGCSCTGSAGGIGLGVGSIGGLSNEFGVARPTGPESGQAFFTPHYTEDFERWREEAERRSQGYASLNNHRGIPLTSVQYQHRFSEQLHRRYCDPGPCRLRRRFPTTFVGSRITRTGPRYDKPRPPPEPTPGGDVSGGSPIQGGGVPIGGVGVHEGSKDTPPPPSPEKVLGDGLCRKKWWYNTATTNCYPSRQSCWADGVTEQSRQCLLHRP